MAGSAPEPLGCPRPTLGRGQEAGEGRGEVGRDTATRPAFLPRVSAEGPRRVPTACPGLG